ncbi:MAG: helix-turn-helix domain-containing protein [Chloroflexi bacterium]|nr:helix-turn-helix domain-containing protein [Chloroflexota bacterium]
MTTSSQEWFTVEEAAAYLRVSRRTVYKLVEEGRLPAYRIGAERHRRFRREDLDRVPTLITADELRQDTEGKADAA